MSSSLEYWDDKTVMVTGGVGFLSYLVGDLKSRSNSVDIFRPRSDDYALHEKADIKHASEDSQADIVIHLAATVGGIGADRENPGWYFFDNAVMSIELMEQARRLGVEKFTIFGTICAYPKHTAIPFKEENLFDGYPEETSAPYGIAKKALLTQSQAYRKQWDYNSIYLLPVNLYGPNEDFDLDTSHIILAIIRKCIEARGRGDDAITAWGTGDPTQEFPYVKDATEGILDATERYVSSDPVNLAGGEEISVRKLIDVIVEETGFEGSVESDTLKSDGQPRRKLDTSRAKQRFD